MRSDQKKLHLMELFLISLISVYYFVYKRKKAGNLKCLISLIFKSVKISIKKLIRMQKLLYILYENTIWPSGTAARKLLATKKRQCGLSEFFLLNGVTVVISATFGKTDLSFSVYNISKN